MLARADDEHDANVSGADPRIIFGGLAVLHSAGLMLVSTSETPTLVVASHLLMGVGMSLAPSSVTSCQQWFDQRRAAASGVGLSGSGVGQFVVAQLIQALIDGNGGESNPRSWRMAMRAQALCGLVLLVPCALVLRKPSQPASGQQLPLHPSQQQQPVTGATHVIPLRKLAGTRTMRTLLPTVASGSIGYMIPFLFISPFLRNKVGLGAQATSWAVSSMGAPGLNAALPVVLPQRERELTGCGHRCGCDGCAAATAASVGGWVAGGWWSRCSGRHCQPRGSRRHGHPGGSRRSQARAAVLPGRHDRLLRAVPFLRLAGGLADACHRAVRPHVGLLHRDAAVTDCAAPGARTASVTYLP